MLIVYFTIFLMMLCWCFAENTKREHNVSAFECIVMGGALTFIAAFKSIELCSVDDLVNYKNSYGSLKEYSYGDICQQYLEEKIKGGGFWIFSKLCSDLNIGAELWMAIIGFVFATAYSWFCYKYSKNIFISYLTLLALVFSFTLTGLRQTLALSLILLAYYWIFEKKPKHFIATVLLAFCQHSSAIIFLPAYWLAQIKFRPRNIFIALLILIVLFLFPEMVRQLISELAPTEQMGKYAERFYGLSWAGAIIQSFIFFYCLIFWNHDTPQKEEETRTQLGILMNFMLVSIVFLGISVMVAESFRLAYYYNICNGIALAGVICLYQNPKKQQFAFYGIWASLILYMLYSRTYSGLMFIWQE